MLTGTILICNIIELVFMELCICEMCCWMVFEIESELLDLHWTLSYMSSNKQNPELK